MFKLVLSAVLIFLFTSCQTLQTKLKYRQQAHMGTYISVGAPSYKDSTAVFKIFKKLDNKWSTYKEFSLISQINKKQTKAIDSETFEILKLSKKLHKKTDSLFSISWMKHNISSELGFKLGPDTIQLSKGVRLNLGGIAKGYAVDQAVAYFKSKAINQYKVSASGDIACGGGCELKVQHPFKEGAFASFKSLSKDLRVSTSGNYRRYKINPKNHHIKNPQTQKSSRYLSSLTLLSNKKSAELDAVATAGLATNSIEEFKRLMIKFPDIAYLSVSNQGLVDLSPHIYSYIDELTWLDLTDLKRVTKQSAKNN